MRNISFALTTNQIRQRQKTVTRRVGWLTLKPGTLLQPVVKGQGLKKGEHVETIGGPIRVVRVDRVVLGDISPQDVYREGFPQMTTRDFVSMFKMHNGGLKGQVVTRIEFEYEAESIGLEDVQTTSLAAAGSPVPNQVDGSIRAKGSS